MESLPATEPVKLKATEKWRWTGLSLKPVLGIALLLSAVLPAPAQMHVVPRERLHEAIGARQQQARESRAVLLETLGNAQARKALHAAGIEFATVEQAVANLDDATATKLAERAAAAKKEFAAGALSNEMLTYIVIALATAVLVIIAVN